MDRPSAVSHVRPADWPEDGPIDLRVQDLPHASATTEWWYVNSHLTLENGAALSVFAAFFQIVSRRHADGTVEHARSLTWAISDPSTREYHPHSLVDSSAPRIALEKMKAGHGTKDERLNRAVSEVLERGRVPRPDRFFPGPVAAASDRLALDYAGCSFEKISEGEYRLSLSSGSGEKAGEPVAELLFTLSKPPVRHGDNGLVRGVHGEDMFYYFVPRCEVRGHVVQGGQRVRVAQGQGWYDHEFGSPPPRGTGGEPSAKAGDDHGVVAWSWISAQLDDGTDVSVYDLVHADTGQSAGRWAVLSDARGRRYAFEDFTLVALCPWRSVRTFETYPTEWRVEIPEARLSLTVTADFSDQELVTVISKPAFWEGRCSVEGQREGARVRGLGYVERSGYSEVETLDDFFKRVGDEVRSSVRRVYPLELERTHAEALVAAPGAEHYLDGVDLPQLARTLLAPVREITDRGGKAWRSYAALACCDVVLGDSRRFAEWLAMPELMHVGSLIVDDVQDRSTVRRGGPAAHLQFGEALAVNAGTAAYFLGERLLKRSLLTDQQKLRVYDLYFESMRAGHAGQAIDLDGLDSFVARALETGEVAGLEARVLAIHRLKTAAPASALARMGAVAGGGSPTQVEAIGTYFEALGLAFQIIDDVLNLRGFKGDLKQRGEDIAHGKVTLPVAKAFTLLNSPSRTELWRRISAHPTEPAEIAGIISELERCGAVEACVAEASERVETGWRRLEPLVEDSLPKVMLRAFGWYVLQRHY